MKRLTIVIHTATINSFEGTAADELGAVCAAFSFKNGSARFDFPQNLGSLGLNQSENMQLQNHLKGMAARHFTQNLPANYFWVG